MLWAISCIDKPEAEALRMRYMQVHRDYLDRQEDILVLAGATLTDDGTQPTGSLFIVNVRTRADARGFSEADPFTQAGVFASVAITRLRKSQWNPGAAEKE